MKAILALEDGTVFHGESFGAPGEVDGEVIFNTSMTGYQEILTDPSYRGQIIVMTYPLIGNYGVNRTDVESPRPQAAGFVIRYLSPVASNWRGEQTLEEWLTANKTPAIQGIDTRALTCLLREKGALKGILSTCDLDEKKAVDKSRSSPGLIGRDLVKEVTCSQVAPWPERPKRERPLRVAAVDCGMKANIPRMLTQAGCQVTIVPATVTPKQIFGLQPDGLFLSNGPGDPEGLPYLVSTVREATEKIPAFGICLGHQILGLAFGGKTYKLKFGHHGANHPVMDLKTGKVEITAQNHGFSVDPGSIPGGQVEMTHVNLNDKTCEGMRHKQLPIFSVQYHPEASPGPHDAHHLFQRFIRCMERGALSVLLAAACTGAALAEVAAGQGEIPPIRVRFEAPAPVRTKEPVSLHLIVERDPRGWPQAAPEGELELLLRLPSGVRLESKEWKPVPLPPGESKDRSGTWFLFEKREPINSLAGNSLLLAWVPLQLSVAEEGVNWVITARARVDQKGKVRQGFGVVFATLQEGHGSFHARPKTASSDSAQANRP
ncbi:MAG: glutamine-hydrolyzing carbamoyl-phosphate synthase small subunit [Candidatus Omnitrophica bacterium]|nr:glutamine-hydrolyzing carbamoyl-phosphate synthase small subunit [Candidatus Omnitrophota bacterium]